jgi:fructan beta-fructosidase
LRRGILALFMAGRALVPTNSTPVPEQLMYSRARFVILALSLVLGRAASAGSDAAVRYDEPYRPQYHFSPQKGWLGDPDGLILYHGKFSMFWWGKATSADLVHYSEESPLVMTGAAGNVGYFSGSVVVDERNTAGFGANAQIAIYTLFDKSTKRQAQAISHSSDGRNFEFFQGNPVLDIGSTEFRDPTVFWHTPTQKWIMAVALAREKKIAFYASQDLKHWTWMSDFTGGTGHTVWECPDLFELAVDGNPDKKRWVLVISVDWDHEEYFVGDFDGLSFKSSSISGINAAGNSDKEFYVDRGLDFYASRTFRDYDGTSRATTSLGWVATWAYANQVPSAWGKGFWSIPRELALETYPEGIRLVQKPIERLTSLRSPPVTRVSRLRAGTHALPAFQPHRNVYEIDATFGTDPPNVFGLDLCVGNGRKVEVRYDSRSQVLTIDRTNSSAVPIPDFAREASAVVTPADHHLRLHIYVDKSSVEVFANEGRAVFTLLTYAGDAQTEIDTVAEHAGTIMDLKAWRLASIWRTSSHANRAARPRPAAAR